MFVPSSSSGPRGHVIGPAHRNLSPARRRKRLQLRTGCVLEELKILRDVLEDSQPLLAGLGSADTEPAPNAAVQRRTDCALGYQHDGLRDPHTTGFTIV